MSQEITSKEGMGNADTVLIEEKQEKRCISKAGDRESAHRISQ